MKQILQDLRTGSTSILEAPAPSISKGTLIVKSAASLVSLGTERMLVEFGRASYFQKARQQPEKVKSVLEKAVTDGLAATAKAVQSKLAEPIPLGYCNVGVVTAVGSEVKGFEVGDRVVSNAPHADIARISKNLCAHIPDGVTDEEAVFAILGSIGLQGIRLAQPSLGESFVVFGVGLIGLLTVQLLCAHGCRVLAIDFDDKKLALAKDFGADAFNLNSGDSIVEAENKFSRGQGVDGVIIAASTKSSDPVAQAARMCRKRGRIVLVGVTGLELNRADFYEKELSFHVSCSYGPGRYDPLYEEKGQDYPLGFVRWTARRNFEAVLDMMASGKLNVKPLISHRVAFEDAPSIYENLSENKESLGILLEYPLADNRQMTRSVALTENIQFDSRRPILGFVGAGNYASRILIPAFKSSGGQLHTIVTSSGTSGAIHGKKARFSEATTDLSATLLNKEISAVVIATRHDSHAKFVAQALRENKSVFVEKPLAIDSKGLNLVRSTFSEMRQSLGDCAPQLMVGYNRRFSPQIKKIKSLLEYSLEPKSFIMTMNAGAIPPDHWTQDPAIGGGRIVGEACHYIDLMRFLAGSPIVSVQARCMGRTPGMAIAEDKSSITLGFEDGSFGTIFYLANGSVRFPKERVEIFSSGRALQLDNFRKLKGYGWPGLRKMNLWRQDKGQAACAKAFLDSLENGLPAIPVEEIFEVAQVTLDIADILRNQ
jgi:predicted dehydrogenase/threonine dehydrogenase-like Zn-dependent dehydrogenase